VVLMHQYARKDDQGLRYKPQYIRCLNTVVVAGILDTLCVYSYSMLGSAQHLTPPPLHT
jgi:hypothetical protein